MSASMPDHCFAPAVRLDEFTVKDLRTIINPTDLPHRDYEPLLRQIEYQGTEKDVCKWLVHNRLNGWETYVQFMDWQEQLADTSLNAVEVANLLQWSGDVRLYCKCPSFKFWGYQYILTQLQASIVPEDRFPHIRNPLLKGICCKHLRKLFRVLPFQTGPIAAAIKQQRAERGIEYLPRAKAPPATPGWVV
jgi:hypothetical protein